MSHANQDRPLILDEFRRIRVDFEAKASTYPDETLKIVFLESGKKLPPLDFREPSHVLPLWQYMGNFETSEEIENLRSSITTTKYGVSGCQLAAMAALEGQETELFRRMAARAGSILPADIVANIWVNLCNHFIDAALPGKPVLTMNSNHLAVWLNLVLTCIVTLQPRRLDGLDLVVDPFAASIPACEFIISRLSRGPDEATRKDAGSQSNLSRRKFQVALSFPGEWRGLVASVAAGLRAANVEVFYDAYFEAELARPDLDILLQQIYHDNSDLVVVFLCKEYESKEWCGLEWRALRDLIKKRRAASIMPMRLDDAAVPGLFSIDGYADIRDRATQEIVDMICTRLSKMS